MAERPLHRSFLFSPGSDESKLRKAVQAGADAVVFDLEDSVRAEDKADARQTVARVIAELAPAAVVDVHVRVNRISGGYDFVDLAAVVVPGLAAVRLPKCEAASEVAAVSEALDELEARQGIPIGSVLLYPTIESAAGVLAAKEIAGAGPRVAALVFGPADFAASVRITAPSFEATLVARSTLVLASAAAGVSSPIDGAYLDLTDLAGLRTHSRRVKELGFGGKSAIHPHQIPVLHDVFTPSEEELARAQRILAAVGHANTTGVVDGGFVDPPVVAQARAVLELARRIEEKGG